MRQTKAANRVLLIVTPCKFEEAHWVEGSIIRIEAVGLLIGVRRSSVIRAGISDEGLIIGFSVNRWASWSLPL
jgi:hypothetical protein